MRSMIVLVVLGVTACAQMSAPRTEESMALAQTRSITWQDEDGKVLSAVQVQEAYRACQNRMFNPFQASQDRTFSPFRASQDSTFSQPRATQSMVTPLYDEHVRLALSDPEFNVCMQSFGYSRVDSPTDANRTPG